MWWFFFFQIMATENLQNHFFFESLIFNFSFLRNSARKENKKGRFAAASVTFVRKWLGIPTNAQQQSFPSLEDRADVSGAVAVAVELAIAQPAELAKNHLK